MFVHLLFFVMIWKTIPKKHKIISHFLKKKWKSREGCGAQFCHLCDIDSDGGHNCPYCSLHQNGADKCATCAHVSQMSHQNWLLTNSSKTHTISATDSPIVLTKAEYCIRCLNIPHGIKPELAVQLLAKKCLLTVKLNELFGKINIPS